MKIYICGFARGVALVAILIPAVAYQAGCDGQAHEEGTASKAELTGYASVKWQADPAGTTVIHVCWENTAVTSRLPSPELLRAEETLRDSEVAAVKALARMPDPDLTELTSVALVVPPPTVDMLRNLRNVTDAELAAYVEQNNLTFEGILWTSSSTTAAARRYVARREVARGRKPAFLERKFDVTAAQGWVKAAILETWQKQAAVDFTGWNSCAETCTAGGECPPNVLRVRAIGNDVAVAGNEYFARPHPRPVPDYFTTTPFDEETLANTRRQRSFSDFPLFDTLSQSRVEAFGNQLDERPSGLLLNLAFGQEVAIPEYAEWVAEAGARQTHSTHLRWAPGGCGRRGADTVASVYEPCVRANAVHEFGHVLGMAHEQLRLQYGGDVAAVGDGGGVDGGLPDPVPACRNAENIPLTPDPSPNYVFYHTPYDAHSIMNYCRDELRLPHDWDLSPDDIRGIQRVYGVRR